jgi:hypothetical protein
MAPRGYAREIDWKYWLYKHLTRILVKIEFVLYATICVAVYTLIFRSALPEKLALVFLVVLLAQGFPTGQSLGKAAALVQDILKAVIKVLADKI